MRVNYKREEAKRDEMFAGDCGLRGVVGLTAEYERRANVWDVC